MLSPLIRTPRVCPITLPVLPEETHCDATGIRELSLQRRSAAPEMGKILNVEMMIIIILRMEYFNDS